MSKKVKFTGSELFDLDSKFEEASNARGLKVVYAISKNHAIVKSEVKTIKAAITKLRETKVEGFDKWDEERMALCKELGEKDDKGEPVMIDNNFKIIDMAAFNKRADEIKLKHKPVMDALDKRDADIKKFVEDEVTLDLHTIKMSDIVDNDVTKAQMDVIQLFLEE